MRSQPPRAKVKDCSAIGRLVLAGGRTQLADMASAVRGLGRGLTTIVKGQPGALADTVRLGEAVTPEGARLLTMGADSGPLRDLFMAAAADARGTGGGADIAWTGEGGLTPTAEQNAAADQFIARAADAEPGIRATLTGSLSDVPGASMDKGLPNALKTPDSLKRKVATALVEDPGRPVADVVDSIRDSVRYTVEVPEGSYNQGVQHVVSNLRENGLAADTRQSDLTPTAVGRDDLPDPCLAGPSRSRLAVLAVSRARRP